MYLLSWLPRNGGTTWPIFKFKHFRGIVNQRFVVWFSGKDCDFGVFLAWGEAAQNQTNINLSSWRFHEAWDALHMLFIEPLHLKFTTFPTLL